MSNYIYKLSLGLRNRKSSCQLNQYFPLCFHSFPTFGTALCNSYCHAASATRPTLGSALCSLFPRIPSPSRACADLPRFAFHIQSSKFSNSSSHPPPHPAPTRLSPRFISHQNQFMTLNHSVGNSILRFFRSEIFFFAGTSPVYFFSSSSSFCGDFGDCQFIISLSDFSKSMNIFPVCFISLIMRLVFVKLFVWLRICCCVFTAILLCSFRSHEFTYCCSLFISSSSFLLLFLFRILKQANNPPATSTSPSTTTTIQSVASESSSFFISSPMPPHDNIIMKPTLKFTFNNKTYIIPKQVETYDQFMKKILERYPQELSEGFKLYIAINYDEDPVEVQSAAEFQRVYQIYQSTQRNSLKYLVKEKNSRDLSQEDLQILYQSVKSSVNQQTQASEKGTEQKVEKAQRPPEQNVPQVQHKKNSSNHYSKSQATDATSELQEIVSEQFQAIPQPDPLPAEDKPSPEKFENPLDYYGSEKFREFFFAQIDQKLLELGLIKKHHQQEKLPSDQLHQPSAQGNQIRQEEKKATESKEQYKMNLVETKPNRIDAVFGELKEWIVKIRNIGDCVWKPNEIFLVCQAGALKSVNNNKAILEKQVEPGQVGTFYLKVQMPEFSIRDGTPEFRLGRKTSENPDEFIYFGSKVGFTLNLRPPEIQDNFSISQRDGRIQSNQANENFQAKIKQFMQQTKLAEQQARDIINRLGQEKACDELVRLYKQSQKR